MKKILIFSDTHGDINRCLDIIEKADSVSAIFHAGDYTGDAEDLESIYPNIPIYYVKGNNDYFSKAPSHLLVTIDGVKIFITHGHEQNVKYEYEFMTLRKAAEKYDPDLIIFGHTHIPYTDYKGKATLLNPGSIRYTGTYAEAEIENGKLKTKIIEVWYTNYTKMSRLVTQYDNFKRFIPFKYRRFILYIAIFTVIIYTMSELSWVH